MTDRGLREAYEETFDNGPGGWCAWGVPGAPRPDVRDGVFYTRSPWRVDPNHAPPGAGYLHLLAYLHTGAKWATPAERPTPFLDRGYSRDFTNARFSLRLRGEVDLRGANLTLWAQAELPHTTANYALTGQRFEITRDWSEQSVTLVPDESQWVCAGAHHEQEYRYGCGTIAEVLRDCNLDLIIVLFPLKVVATDGKGEEDYRRTHRDYEPDYRYLPEGRLEFDTVRIEYPNS